MKRFYFLYDGKGVWKTSSEVTAAAGKDLKHADYLNRRFAAAAMHELHKQTGEAAQVKTELEGLVELLEDDDSGVRYWAMATIASLPSKAVADYCEAMAGKLKDKDAGVRTYAAIGLAGVGHVCDAAFDYIPDLVDALEDSDPQVRIEATKAIAEMVEAEDLDETAAAHLTSLKDRRFPIFRASAAESMGALGEAGLPFVADLKNALNDTYPRVREAAAKALGQLGLEAMKDTCVELANIAQNDPEMYVRTAASIALDQMNLSEALDHEASSYRAWAAEMLVNKGHKYSAPLRDQLGELLKDADGKVRYWCAEALGDVPEAASDYLPALLLGAVNDADPDARVTATKACVKLNQGEAKKIGPDITPTLTHEDPAFRRSAARCLGALGADALPQAPALNERLVDEDPEVRLATVRAIQNMGKQAARACGPNLGECSRTDTDHDVRKWSAYLLHELGLAARYGAPDRKGVI